MMKTVSLCDLNQHIVCKLCHGYYIDPVTLVECLHSFCKTCIVKHVTSNKMCPVCDVQIHKTKPFVSMRSDKTLQNIVYKLVPGLYKNEMQRRKKFMEKHEPTKVPREQLEKHFFFRDDNISMSIEYYDPQNPDGSSPDKSNPNKRYLACPGTVKIQQLKKFIIMKYGLNDNFLVDVIYMNDLIPEDYTLIDVAYYYEWKKDAPMKFFYRIFKKNRVLLKRRKRKLETDESSTPTPTDDAKKRKSCSMDDDTSNTAGTSGAGGGSSNGCDGLAGTGISGRDQSVDVRSCPVASHAKKNDTTANATDCSVKPDEAVHDHKEAAPDPDEAKGHNDSITKSEQSNGSTEKPKATQDEGRLMELQNLDKKNSGGGHNDKVNNNNNNNKEPEKRPQLQPKLSLSKQSKPGPPGGQILSVVNNLAKKQQHLEAAAAAAAAASAPSTSSISSASPNTTARTLSEAVAVTCSSQICPTVTAVTTSSETLRAPLANGFSPTSSVAKSPPTTPSLKGPLPSILSMKNFVQASKPAEREELNPKKNTTPSPTQPKPPQPVVPELRQFRKFPLATNTTTTTTSTTTTTTSPESSSCPSVMSSSTTAGAALSLTSTRLPIFPQLTLSGRNGSSSSPKISLSSATSPSHRSMSAKSEDISRSSPSSSPSSSSAVLQLALANSNSQSSTSTTSCKSVPITSTALTVTPAQLPSSRLQLKVQNTLPSPLPATPATTPVSTASLISPYQAAFQSTLYSHYAADALWKQATLALAAASAGSNGAAVAAAAAAAVGAAPSSSGSSSTTTTNNAGNNGMSSFGSGSNGTKTLLPKTLNQGIRQIPNPSLLTKQHQHATSANSNSDPLLQEKVIMAMAAAASVANTRPSTTN